ncbi:hypothetical protein EMCRGX_G010644 [Ephydatia muelleri]
MTSPLGCCSDDRNDLQSPPTVTMADSLVWGPLSYEQIILKFILSSTSIREVLSHDSTLRMLLRRQEELQSPPTVKMANSSVWGPLSFEQIILKFILSSTSIREVLSHDSTLRMLLRRQEELQSPPTVKMANSSVWGPLSHE